MELGTFTRGLMGIIIYPKTFWEEWGEGAIVVNVILITMDLTFVA